MTSQGADASVMDQLSRHMAEARSRELPAEVVREGEHRILDSFTAVVSGARLKPGQMAIKYIRTLGGTAEAQVVGSDIVTSAGNAALANGMLGHANESDDTHMPTKCHPGCAIIPAAFAMGERENASGVDFLRAITLGYDLCCRMVRAMDATLLHETHRSTQGIGPTFGCAAAVGSLAKLDATQMRHVLSYAAQQASGIRAWSRDIDHIEKAFDFGGMGARNGVMAATMVQAGFTGVWDVLSGEHNVLDAFSTQPRPEEIVGDLGTFFEITNTAIKAYPVGYPIQSALDALFTIMKRDGIRGADVKQLVAILAEDGARIVNDRDMPDISIQHVLALALVDEEVTFDSTHDYERMRDPAILEMRKRVHLRPDKSLVDPKLPRQAIIEITTNDGRTLSHHTMSAPGSVENPLSREQIAAKARDLMTPVLGPDRTEQLITKLQNLAGLKSVRELRPLLAS